MYQIVFVCFFLSDWSCCKMGVARSRYEHGLLLWVASADCLTKVFQLLLLEAHVKCCISHELNVIILMSKIYCFCSLEFRFSSCEAQHYFDWGPYRVSSCLLACLLPRIIFYKMQSCGMSQQAHRCFKNIKKNDSMLLLSLIIKLSLPNFYVACKPALHFEWYTKWNTQECLS